MQEPGRWTLGSILLLLFTPVTAGAVFVRETPAEIVGMRGMVPAIGICVIGLVLLRYAPVSAAPGEAPEGRPRARRSDWLVLLAYVLVVYATVPVGFQVVRFIVQRIGMEAFRASVNTLGLVAGFLFLGYVVRQRRLRRSAVYLRLAVIVAAYAYFFTVLEVPVKRVHFLEFSLLSALAFRAFRPFTGPPAIYLWVTLAAMVVGIGDEGIALFFPRRFAAISDVIWDTTAGVLGALVLKFILLKS